MTKTLAIALTLALAGVVLHPSAPAAQESLAGSTAPPFALDSATKASTLEALFTNLNETYIRPENATKIEAALKQWMAGEDYAKMTNGLQFAAKVNDLIKSQVTDAHLRFRYSEKVLPVRESPREPSKDEMRRYAEETRYQNAGFEKIERLRGNIGYISFRGFWGPEDMARPMEGAAKYLQNVDAFIVDLRENGGGDPRGVQLFCSYFFDTKPVHLNDIYFRNGTKVEKTEFWTLKKVDGPRFPDIPLYVLTSKRTGSGAEECAYNFQNLHRGPIVGSSTWGGANPGGTVRLSDHFSCFIPVGRAENPYTKTNWEGSGVIPDVAVEPAEALKTAHLMALRKLASEAKDAERKTTLEQIIEEISKGI